MPSKTGKLNSQEKVFVEQVVKTGNPVYAAAIAGYKQPQPRASQNLAKPQIQAEIIAGQARILVEQLLPASTIVLAAALDMKTVGVPWNARITAAKIVRGEVAGMAGGAGAKDLADMTADELHAALEEAQRLLSDRARPVDQVVGTSPFD